MVMSLLNPFINPFIKMLKSRLVSLGHLWRPEKLRFAATVAPLRSLGEPDQRPLSCPYRTRPAALCSDPERQILREPSCYRTCT